MCFAIPLPHAAVNGEWMQKLFRKFWVTQTSRPHCKCTPIHLCSPNAVCWRLPVPCPALPKKHIRRHYFGQEKEKCRLSQEKSAVLSSRGFLDESFFAFLLYHRFAKTRVERCRIPKIFVSKSIVLTINIIDSVHSIPLRVYCLTE